MKTNTGKYSFSLSDGNAPEIRDSVIQNPFSKINSSPLK